MRPSPLTSHATQTPSDSVVPQTHTRQLWWVLSFVGVTALFFGFGGGVNVGAFNHTGLLPVVQRLLNPQYLPGDFSIALREYHHRIFAWVVARGTQFIGQTATFVVLTLAARLLLAFALWQMCRTLRLGWVAFLAVGLALAAGAFSAGSGLEGNDLVGSSAIMPPPFAHALALCAMAALINKRYVLSTACVGLALGLHQQIGLVLTLLFLPFWLHESRDLSLAQRGAMVGMWGLLAAPALYHLSEMLGRGLTHEAAGGMTLLQAIKYREPHHFAFLPGKVAGVVFHLVALGWVVRQFETLRQAPALRGEWRPTSTEGRATTNVAL